MRWRRLGIQLTVFAVLLGAGLGVLRYLAARDALPDGINPASAFYTRHHEAGYGAIDRWATYGMNVQALVDLLGRDGYTCDPPKSVAGERLNGVHDMICEKQTTWPLARTLDIKASVDYGQRGRLVAAHASSTWKGKAWFDEPIQRFLRSTGLIEPAQLQVKGFEIDSVDKLAQYVLDLLGPGGWPEVCNGQATQQQCSHFIETRREAGFPPLPQGAANTRGAMSIASIMESIRFMPVEQRGADGQATDALLVRVDGEHMWLDFTGQDLTGRKLAVSIALAPEGGAPVQLVAQLGWENGPVLLANNRQLTDRGAIRFVPLAGARRDSTAGVMPYLVPLAGAQKRRFAIWIDMPDRADPHPYIFQMWATVLPKIEPAFLPQIIRAAVRSVAKARSPDEILGLYPKLRIIENRADQLRRAWVKDWMPAEQGDAFIRQEFGDDPVTRAAWQLANCEWKPPTPKGNIGDRRRPMEGENIALDGPTVIDVECWRRRASDDEEVVNLLRQEVAALEPIYADLEPSHPLRVRLRKLHSVLSPDLDRTNETVEPVKEKHE